MINRTLEQSLGSFLSCVRNVPKKFKSSTGLNQHTDSDDIGAKEGMRAVIKSLKNKIHAAPYS